MLRAEKAAVNDKGDDKTPILRRETRAAQFDLSDLARARVAPRCGNRQAAIPRSALAD
jgi:hypothetical protein